MAGVIPSGAVPFVDDKGKLITNYYQQQMVRPINRPPSFFTSRGKRDKLIGLVSGGIGVGASLADDGYEAAELYKFRQGGPWDVQRINGVEHREFIDYASVGIGLYCASAGISFSEVMLLQDQYAARRSHFQPQAIRDKIYKYLLVQNVFNTKLGFTLYESGRIK